MEITKEMIYTASQAANHQQLRVMYDAMKAERDALSAQIGVLLAHGSALATAASMATGALPIDSAVTEFCVEAVRRFNSAKAATPQQHLAEIRAQAGRDGYAEGYENGYQAGRVGASNRGRGESSDYADSIRQEK